MKEAVKLTGLKSRRQDSQTELELAENINRAHQRLIAMLPDAIETILVAERDRPTWIKPKHRRAIEIARQRGAFPAPLPPRQRFGSDRGGTNG